MTRTAILVVMGGLLLGSVCRAEAPGSRTCPIPRNGTIGVVSGCNGPGCGGCYCKRSFLEWLLYRPLYRPGLCGCHKHPACCRPPLYLWFIDYCYVGGGSAYPLRVAPAVPCCGHPHWH
ncbi:MAG TPA: hypothetical protein VNK04_15480 [Gemmataceae bacterium]|nr:hypothetical protein [Gemmataceae bacterium]